MGFLNITTSTDLESISELIDRFFDELVTNHGWVAEFEEGTVAGDDLERWISKPAAETVNGDLITIGAHVVKALRGNGTQESADWELELVGSNTTAATAINQLTVTDVEDGATDARITFSGNHNLIVGDRLEFDNSMTDLDNDIVDLASFFNGNVIAVDEVVNATQIRVGIFTQNRDTYDSGGACRHPFEWTTGCPQRDTVVTSPAGSQRAENEPSGVNFLGNEGPFTQAWFFTPNRVTFDGTTGVDDVAEEIDVTAHGFLQNQEVVYNNGGGATVTGLTNGQSYFVNVVSANAISLHNTLQDARDDTNRVGLTDTAASAANTLSTHIYAYCVVEVVPGIYRSFGFGEAIKFGTWDGGAFVLGNWINSVGDEAEDSHDPFCMSPGDDSLPTNINTIIKDGILTRSNEFGVNPALSQSKNNNGWMNTRYVDLGTFHAAGREGMIHPSRWAIGAPLLVNNPSPFSGLAHRHPCRQWMHINSDKAGDVQMIAEYPDLFNLNIRDMTPGTKVTDDSQEFMVFSFYRKGATAPSTGDMGFLVRNTSLP